MAAASLHEPVLVSCLIGIVVQKDYDALVQEMLFRADAPIHYELQPDGSAVLSYPEAERFWPRAL